MAARWTTAVTVSALLGVGAITASAQPASPARATATAFADVADDVSPSVVGIASPQSEPAIGTALVLNGSGVVIDDRGDIVTPSSVLAGAARAKVTLPDGRETEGRVIGTDPTSGLAVLRVSAGHLAPARLGDARKMRNGDWLLAVGRAGREHTVSVGVLSSKESTHLIGTGTQPNLETDALIGRDNVGGALVNLDGEVVGICLLGQERGVTGRAIPAWRVRPAVARVNAASRAARRAPAARRVPAGQR